MNIIDKIKDDVVSQIDDDIDFLCFLADQGSITFESALNSIDKLKQDKTEINKRHKDLFEVLHEAD